MDAELSRFERTEEQIRMHEQMLLVLTSGGVVAGALDRRSYKTETTAQFTAAAFRSVPGINIMVNHLARSFLSRLSELLRPNESITYPYRVEFGPGDVRRIRTTAETRGLSADLIMLDEANTLTRDFFYNYILPMTAMDRVALIMVGTPRPGEWYAHLVEHRPFPT